VNGKSGEALFILN